MISTLTNSNFQTAASDTILPEEFHSPIYQPLLEAIAARRNVRLKYEGDRLPRLVSPYLLRRAKKGHLTIIAMQIENPNALDDDNQMRQFNFDKVASMELTDENFVPIDTFTPKVGPHSTGITAYIFPWKAH